jgi:hypothetical protein
MTGPEPNLEIEFTTEELLTLTRLLGFAELPGLGPDPLRRASPSGLIALFDGGHRALAARGLLSSLGTGPADVEPDLARLIRILARPGLLVSALRIHAGTEECRYYAAEPSVMVEHRANADGIHKLAAFHPEDLRRTVFGFLGLGEPTIDTDPIQPVELTVPLVSLRECAHRALAGEEDGAVQSLTETGGDARAANTFVSALVNRLGSAAVVTVHRPDETVLAGGELAWIDAGERGIWITPLVNEEGSVELTGSDQGVDDIPVGAVAAAPVTIRRVSAAKLMDELQSYLPGELVSKS